MISNVPKQSLQSISGQLATKSLRIGKSKGLRSLVIHSPHCVRISSFLTEQILIWSVLVFNTRASYWISNAIGVVKLLTLIFVGITGLVVLGGHTRVKDPHMNFRDPFDGHTTPYGITNSLVKIVFAYSGYDNVFNVVNEIKVMHIAEWRSC